MEFRTLALKKKSVLLHGLFDLLAVTLVVFTPALSHLASVPVWMLEPMRVMVILALLFTKPANAFLLAVILPLCSWLTSGHPEPLKMAVIMVELCANAAVFLVLKQMFRNAFLPVLISIVASKIFCYLLYLIIFPLAFFIEEAEPRFLLVQAGLTLFLSALAGVLKNKENPR